MRHATRITVCCTGFILALTSCQCGVPPEMEDDAGVLADGGSGGGGTGPDGGACLAGLQALSISPAGSTVTVTGSSASAVLFAVQGTFADGSTRDMTNAVAWSVSRNDDTPAGSISEGHYQPAANTGGLVTVRASDGCTSAQTTLSLSLKTTFQDPGPTTTDRFGGTVVTTDQAKSPLIVYPHSQSRFPRNLYKVLFQWRKNGNDYFRLTFEGPHSTTLVYSDGAHLNCAAATPPAGCYEADSPAWQAIAGANAGEAITLVVDGVRAGDSNVYRSKPITLGFSKRDVRGAIFYWSTTAAGIRRASVSDAAPEGYVVGKPVATVLPSPGGKVDCVACHTVSRSGKKIVAYTKSSTSTGIYVYDVTLQPPPTPVITTQISSAKGFGTFSPDDQQVVATVGDKLAEFNAATGASLGQLPVPLGTNPDWSPTGAELVYSNRGGDSPGGAGLDIVARDGGSWGPIRSLAPANGLSNLFPSYSPDGQWIVYARGKGGHGDSTFQLFLKKADGSSPAVELINANRPHSNLPICPASTTCSTGLFENNMPTWAPPGDLDWIAFNTRRPYGVVYPNGGTQQLWVTGIDRSKLGVTGPDGGLVDPSFPAFRFAFQGLAENNHRAFWTLDVRQPEDGGTCRVLGAECSPGKNDCCTGGHCLSNTEVTFTCQPPGGFPDAGACLPEAAACDQVSGPACCGDFVCDEGDGGTVCKDVVIN